MFCTTLGWVAKQIEIKDEWNPAINANIGNTDAEMIIDDEVNIGADAYNDDGMIIDLPDEEIPLSVIPKIIFASRTHSQLSQGEKRGFLFGRLTFICLCALAE